MPVDGFRDHVATDGSLLGVAGPWWKCGWTVVQLGHDEEMGVRGGQSSQPSSVSSERWIVPPQLMWITKGSSMGLGEENCSALAQKRSSPMGMSVPLQIWCWPHQISSDGVRAQTASSRL